MFLHPHGTDAGRMVFSRGLGLAGCLLLAWSSTALRAAEPEPLFTDTLSTDIPHVSTDDEIRYDYDIVYVRADRAGDEVHKRYYTDFSQPVTLEPGADLMLLHPDGSEELLVDGGEGSVTDPVVSFDGEWVYYTYIYDLVKRSPWNPPRAGADIFKIHVPTRRIVRLTNQRFTPNLGAARWADDFRTGDRETTRYDYGVFNMGPHPLPGGKIVFTSNRDGFRPAQGYPAIALQMFVMDDRDTSIGDGEDPPNLEKIGHLNISGALHPVVLTDGRLMYSSLESQGIRGSILWGIWTINPDGTRWNPLISAFDPGGAPNGFHFQTQLSDGSLIVEEYYNQNNSGFGAYIKLPPQPPAGYAAFGPGYMRDERNKPWRYGRHSNGKGRWYRMPFMPTGSVSLTPFTHGREGPANPSVLADKESPKVGKFTHPSAAPGNHLLTIYSPGPVNHQYKYLPQVDGGIYILKGGAVITEPAQLRVIKNDPNYNESWPRALVAYRDIYGQDEPRTIPRLVSDGSQHPQLAEGTPLGLVGTSSMYKRESYPNGVVPAGEVTARCPDEIAQRDPWKGLDAFTSHGNGMPINWHNQGADAGLYENDEIHAVRVLVMEPTTDRHRGFKQGRQFFSHAMERLRILGEIPVRKFIDGKQPTDPDGNPDTSFLAKIPADVAFTFQTIDKNGMLLNMAQTWHQLRPGEVRHDCGGCHAHSQQPTLFKDTVAARTDYKVFDLTEQTPLITSQQQDQSQQRWDSKQETGLRYVEGPHDVEYFRDIQPLFKRSCVACHSKSSEKPAAGLVLDDDDQVIDRLPGTYFRLAADERARFSPRRLQPRGRDDDIEYIVRDLFNKDSASHYIWKFQSRRSLLVWKIYGERLDGWGNDHVPSEFISPDDPRRKKLHIPRGDFSEETRIYLGDIDYTGSIMPPPAAVKAGKVEPLSDEDRRLIVRWIDLGCPIDLDPQYDPSTGQTSNGYLADDQRPTVTLTHPSAGPQRQISRLLLGMFDYESGLDLESLTVTADFPIDDAPAGENLASRLTKLPGNRWELKLAEPIKQLDRGTLVVSIKDRSGNVTRIERSLSVSPPE